jgi:hypothetical protein
MNSEGPGVDPTACQGEAGGVTFPTAPSRDGQARPWPPIILGTPKPVVAVGHRPRPQPLFATSFAIASFSPDTCLPRRRWLAGHSPGPYAIATTGGAALLRNSTTHRSYPGLLRSTRGLGLRRSSLILLSPAASQVVFAPLDFFSIFLRLAKGGSLRRI